MFHGCHLDGRRIGNHDGLCRLRHFRQAGNGLLFRSAEGSDDSGAWIKRPPIIRRARTAKATFSGLPRNRSYMASRFAQAHTRDQSALGRSG